MKGFRGKNGGSFYYFVFFFFFLFFGKKDLNKKKRKDKKRIINNNFIREGKNRAKDAIFPSCFVFFIIILFCFVFSFSYFLRLFKFRMTVMASHFFLFIPFFFFFFFCSFKKETHTSIWLKRFHGKRERTREFDSSLPGNSLSRAMLLFFQHLKKFAFQVLEMSPHYIIST